jgi:hypothetical protein
MLKNLILRKWRGILNVFLSKSIPIIQNIVAKTGKATISETTIINNIHRREDGQFIVRLLTLLMSVSLLSMVVAENPTMNRSTTL